MDVRLRGLAEVLFAQADTGAIVPDRIPAKLLPHVFIFDIERGGNDRALQLRIRLAGTAVDQTVGRSTVGHALEEFIHGPRGAQVIAGFHRCANTREPLWMRQVVQIEKKPSRFVEGIAIYLAPERICGGLVGGDVALHTAAAFESEVLTRSK